VKLSALFPPKVLRELDKLAGDLREEGVKINEKEPFQVTGLVLVWLVREVVKLRDRT
jgi:hypothetical protein